MPRTRTATKTAPDLLAANEAFGKLQWLDDVTLVRFQKVKMFPSDRTSSSRRKSTMKFLPAAAVLIALGAAPGLVQAAGQPKLDAQESAAATNGKTPDQAQESKMGAKQERDAQKYQDSGNQAGSKDNDRLAGARSRDMGTQSTAPGYETKSAIDGGGKSSGNAATEESGGKRPPP
jgi:uncharacterized protein HemX